MLVTCVVTKLLRLVLGLLTPIGLVGFDIREVNSTGRSGMEMLVSEFSVFRLADVKSFRYVLGVVVFANVELIGLVTRVVEFAEVGLVRSVLRVVEFAEVEVVRSVL